MWREIKSTLEFYLVMALFFGIAVLPLLAAFTMDPIFLLIWAVSVVVSLLIGFWHELELKGRLVDYQINWSHAYILPLVATGMGFFPAVIMLFVNWLLGFI